MKTEVNIELDDFADEGLYVNVTALVEVTPGEPTVRNYLDGSGYPGLPPEVELRGIIVEEVYDLDGDEVMVDEALETRIEEYLDDNPDLWYEEALDAEEDYPY